MATRNSTNTFQYRSPGVFHTPSYQSAGKPWVKTGQLVANVGSGSCRRIEFPYITKAITITSVPEAIIGGSDGTYGVAHHMYVFFGDLEMSDGTAIATGDNTFSPYLGPDYLPAQFRYENYYTVPASGSITIGIKTDHINLGLVGAIAGISGAWSMAAELTNITSSNAPSEFISGSGINLNGAGNI